MVGRGILVMAGEACFESDDPELTGRDSAASPGPEAPCLSLDLDLERDHTLGRREGVLPAREDAKRPFARLARTSTPSEPLGSILQMRCWVYRQYPPSARGLESGRDNEQMAVKPIEGAT